MEEIGIYPVFGDGNAVSIHRGHTSIPAVRFQSICFIDGDSRQSEDPEEHIYRLPGSNPELTIFNSVFSNLEQNIAFLTIGLQRASEKQTLVARAIRRISHTNRDPHLLFNQVGLNIGFVPEAIVRGAFLTTWIQENPRDAESIVEPVKRALELQPTSPLP